MKGIAGFLRAHLKALADVEVDPRGKLDPRSTCLPGLPICLQLIVRRSEPSLYTDAGSGGRLLRYRLCMRHSESRLSSRVWVAIWRQAFEVRPFSCEISRC